MLKSSTMAEFLSYGQLSFMQVRADLNIERRQFARGKIDNVFISLVIFESYFGGNMTMES